ncbi:MAG TPA: YeeE/YedE family protein [Candidatus Binatia bacterium]|nr:YeeE/YedE family protein [Candidatus Binatia bacterium]
MAEPNTLGGLIGGALIGLAAVSLLALNGRIAGVSGILGGLITSTTRGERFWRLAFISGLIAGAGLYVFARGGLPLELQAGRLTLLVAGLLVGAGTRLGSGCTSGHGVCGLARRSPRSLVATMTFMVAAALTVFLTHHVF